MHLIRIGAIGGIETLVRQRGANPVHLIHEVGLSPSQFRDPNTLISLEKMAELVELCSIECQDTHFGLALGFHQDPGVLMDLLVTASREQSIVEAVENFARHLYLHATGVRLEVLTMEEAAQARFCFEITTPYGIDQMNQLGAGQLINIIAGMVSVTERHHLSIHLRQHAPHQAAPSSTRGRFTVHYGAPFDGVVIDATIAHRRPHLDEAILSQHFSAYLAYLKARYPGNVLSQIKEVIGRLLPSGECSLTRVAATLDLSPRTLQRLLQREATSYGAQLQQVRCAMAQQHLEHSHMGITDLALNLGYSDVSVFSRHFRHWTGQSPRAWRNARVDTSTPTQPEMPQP